MLGNIGRIIRQKGAGGSIPSLSTLSSSVSAASEGRNVCFSSEFLARLNLLNASCQSYSGHARMGGTSPGLQTYQFTSSAHLCVPEPASDQAQINPLLQMPSPTSGPSTSSDPSQPGGKVICVSRYGEGRAGAKWRGISMSAKKVNHFARMIRRMHVDDALAQCQVSVKKAGQICQRLIKSAVHNAEFNHGLDRSKLAIDIINVGRATPRKKRWFHGKGHSAVRQSYHSHLEVILKQSDARPKQRYVIPLMERHRKHFPQPESYRASQLPGRPQLLRH